MGVRHALRHSADHRLGGTAPQRHQRAPGLLRLRIGHEGGDLALPDCDPVLGELAEIAV
jgi:hypothetical protein